MRACRITAIALLAALAGAPAMAQQKDEADLAKQSQNPIASLISLPLQNNTAFDVGPDDDVQNVLNIQPVLPVKVGQISLVNRIIVPVIWQPGMVEGQGSTTGLGDIQYTPFFVPRSKGHTMWGIGPVFQVPTASDEVLGTGKFSAGPSLVFVSTPGRWVMGLLLQNVWSISGDDDRESVNQFLGQYFINYNFDKGWYFSSAPIITADWNADSGNRWTVPFGGGGGRVFKIGKQHVNVAAQVFWNAESPDQAGDWSFRFQWTFLFPK